MITSLSYRTFWLFSIPSILTGIMTTMGGLIGSIFLGHLTSPFPLAGVGLGALVVEFLFYALYFLRFSTITFAGEAFALKDQSALVCILYRSLVLSLGLGMILTLCSPVVINYVFTLFSAEPGVITCAEIYFNTRILGAIPNLCLLSISGWFIGQRQPRCIFMLISFMCLLEIFFSWLFITTYGWAEMGAGYATSLAEWLTLLAGIGWLFYTLREGHFPLRHKFSAIFDWGDFHRYVLLSQDLFTRSVFLLLTFSLFLNASALFGVAFMAATSILIRLLELVAFFIEGLATSVQSMTAIYWTQGDYAQVTRVLRMGCISAFSTVAVAGVIFVGFTNVWTPYLTSLLDVQDIVEHYVIYPVAVLCFSGFAYIFDGFFAAIHKANYLRNAMILAFCVFAPCLWAVYEVHQSPNLLWWSFFAYMAIRTIYLFWSLTHFRQQVDFTMLFSFAWYKRRV